MGCRVVGCGSWDVVFEVLMRMYSEAAVAGRPGRGGRDQSALSLGSACPRRLHLAAAHPN